MHEIEYLFYLTPEETYRLHETLILGEWRPVVRYDTAHGFAHRDLIKANGEVVKQPLFFETHNMAFSHATLDLNPNPAITLLTMRFH